MNSDYKYNMSPLHFAGLTRLFFTSCNNWQGFSSGLNNKLYSDSGLQTLFSGTVAVSIC